MYLSACHGSVALFIEKWPAAKCGTGSRFFELALDPRKRPPMTGSWECRHTNQFPERPPLDQKK